MRTHRRVILRMGRLPMHSIRFYSQGLTIPHDVCHATSLYLLGHPYGDT